ncbi:hypothetical protein [Pseudomonas mangiferae]|uniref:Uncharacterized protein n=1 Tax=Pseudomonas mangiferae TaxID=2593654 RepID=A0A553GZD6_9PSED|nr:hypothetical protein [Pseudomonas mangiferae]TRX74877.1 hypothetical protein FM069_10125 [Pseudomonas mangiferae]
MYRFLLFSIACLAALPGCSPDVPEADHPAIGFIDTPASGQFTQGRVELVGWAVDTDGLQAVEILVNGRDLYVAQTGLERTDVAAARPDLKDGLHAGFRFSADLTKTLSGQDTLEVRTLDRHGHRTTLATLAYTGTPPSPWAELAARHPEWKDDPFYLAVGTSGLTDAQLEDFKAEYAGLDGATVRFGLRVPILYMRTTLGAAADWTFDPAFDVSTRQDDKVVAEDALNPVIALAIAHRVPILFTLNGGVWADARATAPAWDLNDHLEEDRANCQWSEKGEVFPDDYLKNLPGSESSPELANSLTLNVHADTVRAYKRRNLQAAARIIQRFAQAHPELFIGVNLDPDVYLNPFFSRKAWFDYNPGAVQQFREWLSASGPYAEGGPLAAYRRAPITLEQASALAGRPFADWTQVAAPLPTEQFWKDPWFGLWEQFRRHLVALHYEDLARWVAETGIDRAKIFSSQGFNPTRQADTAMPVFIDSPTKPYDTAGVSIEGAKPTHGHLGAILYGDSARDAIPMENGGTLFATLQAFDPDWGIPEFNLADLDRPQQVVDADTAYRALLGIANNGVRFLSPMAWNGSNGLFQGQPGFVAYTSWRHTPQETVFKDLAIQRQGLPRSAKLWPFGLRLNDALDGWQGEAGTRVTAGRGALQATPGGGAATLLSPPLVLDPQRPQLLVLAVEGAPGGSQVEVAWLGEGEARQTLLPPTALDGFPRSAAGYALALPATGSRAGRLWIRVESQATLVIDRVALIPR